jgi:hypothetical protein
MSNWKAIAASAAIINVTCAYAAEPATPIAEPDTANAVSLDPDAPNSYLVFARELDKTLAQMPQLDPVTSIHELRRAGKRSARLNKTLGPLSPSLHGVPNDLFCTHRQTQDSTRETG